MNLAEQKRAARAFVERWKAAEGNEQREANSFWIELCGDVLGIPNPTRALDFERQVRGRRIDVFYEDMGVLIENKSRGIDLDAPEQRGRDAYGNPRMVTPYEQAKWYADNLPRSIGPRWVVCCNFDEMRVHDLDSDDPGSEYVSIGLEELPDRLHLLSFFTDQSASRLVRERELSVRAGEIVGRLYASLSAQYKSIESDPREQRSLNVLIVRLVFLMYAEDAGVLQAKDAFLDYLRRVEPEDMRSALIELFEVLDTPEGERDPYLSPRLAAFPYVDGGLFAERDVVVPQFTAQIKFDLLAEASQGFDWSRISPTIFGAVFESTLNPETRRSGGMHYTSIESIHKVIDPLFLDDLKSELSAIEGEKVERRREAMLRRFQLRLASIDVLDPACGSGNFLTESYISLRRLENRVLEDLMGGQSALSLGDEGDVVKVSIRQLHGIEVNDFAVAVAKTALWIAEEQMTAATQEIVLAPLDFLPLTANDNIVCANALTTDWNDVLPASECDYVIGNPPFVGASMCTPAQKQEVAGMFEKVRLANSLDYVCGWYYKACEYMARPLREDGGAGRSRFTRAALVSTNSITQGEQVHPLWDTIARRFGAKIDFAWRTFVWDSEAADKAHVHVVIIGFSCGDGAEDGTRLIFEDGKQPREASSISPYLIEAPLVTPASRKRPLCNVPALSYGNKPTDDGNLVLTVDERDALLADEPQAARFIRPYVGAKEYLNGRQRWCIWLLGADQREIDASPLVAERVRRVRSFREASSAKDTRKRADSPHEFFRTPVHDVDYMALPRTSSERREYLPIGFFGADTIPSDSTSVIANATPYLFGVLSSRVHMAWVRVVAGRLESRYRYSGDVVYNNFPWPQATRGNRGTPVEQLVASDVRAGVERCAGSVLAAREAHPDLTPADMYDPDKMPSDLRDAHLALDAAVEAAYGVDFGGDEEKIVAHLFKLYAELTEGE